MHGNSSRSTVQIDLCSHLQETHIVKNEGNYLCLCPKLRVAPCYTSQVKIQPLLSFLFFKDTELYMALQLYIKIIYYTSYSSYTKSFFPSVTSTKKSPILLRQVITSKLCFQFFIFNFHFLQQQFYVSLSFLPIFFSGFPGQQGNISDSSDSSYKAKHFGSVQDPVLLQVPLKLLRFGVMGYDHSDSSEAGDRDTDWCLTSMMATYQFTTPPVFGTTLGLYVRCNDFLKKKSKVKATKITGHK